MSDDRAQVWVHPTWRFMGGEFDPETYRVGMGGYWAARVDRAIDEFDGDVAAVPNKLESGARATFDDGDADTVTTGATTRIPYGHGEFDAVYEDPDQGRVPERAIRGLLARAAVDGDPPDPPAAVDPDRVGGEDLAYLRALDEADGGDRFDEAVERLRGADPESVRETYLDHLDEVDDAALAPDPRRVADAYRDALTEAAKLRGDEPRGVSITGGGDEFGDGSDGALADRAALWAEGLGEDAEERYDARVDELADGYDEVVVAGGFYNGCQRRFVRSLVEAVDAEVRIDGPNSYVDNETRRARVTGGVHRRGGKLDRREMEEAMALRSGSAVRDGRLVDEVENVYDDLDVTVDAAGEGVEPER